MDRNDVVNEQTASDYSLMMGREAGLPDWVSLTVGAFCWRNFHSHLSDVPLYIEDLIWGFKSTRAVSDS